MVNFPPVLLESRERLFQIAEKDNVDLIRGGEIFVPDDITDFNIFYKAQIEKYNGIIQEYLLAYKKKKKKVKTNSQSLPQLVKKRGGQELINIKIVKLQEIQEDLNNEMKGFDLSKIIHYLDMKDNAVDSLVDLYKRKFIAIFLEDYEKAGDLKREINKIEGSLPK